MINLLNRTPISEQDIIVITAVKLILKIILKKNSGSNIIRIIQLEFEYIN